jgi:hypothetical protein
MLLRFVRPPGLRLTATLAAVTFAAAVVALSVGARAGRTAPAPQEAGQESQHSKQQQQQQQAGRVEVEHLLLRETGFEPARIARPAGRFLLGVDNRTGLEDVQFRLEREHGEKLREVRVNSRGRGWREPLSLPPGTYRLTEAAHPEWVCVVTITN